MIVRQKLTALTAVILISAFGAGCGRGDDPPNQPQRVFEDYAREELLPTFDPPEHPDADNNPDVTPEEIEETEPEIAVTPIDESEVPSVETPVTPPVVAPPVITPPTVTPPTVTPPTEKPPLTPPVVVAPVIKNEVTQFQVLVFPHEKKYVTPHGRETEKSKVLIKALGTCSKFAAKLNERQEWTKVDGALETKDSFLISAADLTAPAYFECSDGFLVDRGKLESYKYSGNFLAIAKKGTIHIVNLVDPEIYLKGVVPSEVYSSWPLEVLKVQAVAARTYAWWSVMNARKRGIDHYDVDDTVAFQAYSGLSKVRANTNISVEQTNGIVMRSAEGDLIKAYFSADAGGITADSVDVFLESRSYCKSVPETFDTNKLKTWTETVSFAELARMFRGSVPVGTTIKDLAVRTKDRSGRVTSLIASLSNGKKVAVPGVSFSSANKLKSRLYEITQTDGTNATLKGKGFGHGVGMSQEGANQFVAQMNWKFEQILQFYYTGVTLSE